ncbi:MAG: hypothetical protein ABGY95_04950 [Rubritalea sp.]
MHHFFAKLFCLIAAVTILELPAVLLQSYAWATMLSDRIPEQGLSKAVATTFDGEHPCQHCIAAQELQHNKTEPDGSAPVPQFQLGNLKLIGLNALGISLPLVPPSTLLPHRDLHAGNKSCVYNSVPTPPPRLS